MTRAPGTHLQARLEAFAELLRPLAEQAETGTPHYVYVEDYFGREWESGGWLCEAHAEAYTAKYGGKINANPYGVTDDSICCCRMCGMLLDPSSLTDEGIEPELEHWEASILEPVPSQYWELYQLVWAVRYAGPTEIRERVAALQERLGVGA
jgi:hypothetical protein